MTESRRNYMREYKRRQRAKLKEIGICAICCTRPIAAGGKTCERCREYARYYATQRRETERKAAKMRYRRKQKSGICVRCSQPAAYGYILCEKHLIENRERARAYYEEHIAK